MTLTYGVQIKVSQIAGKLDIGYAISADWNRRKQMNKQEAIEKIKNIETLNIKDRIADKGVDMVIKNQVLDIVSQIDEPQKVTIPKFVAEWIEYCKSNKLTLLGAFDPVSEHGIGLADTFAGVVQKGIDWAKRNQETFARAWLDGYEVEQEKLYTVEIPDPNSYCDYTYLSRNDNGICIDASNDTKWKQKKKNQFTESEIKQDFEWVWQFAKPVEE